MEVEADGPDQIAPQDIDESWGALGLDLLAERRISEREPYNHSSFSGLTLLPGGFHALPTSLV